MNTLLTMLRSFVLFILTLFILGSSVYADEMDNVVRRLMKERNIPGAAVAVIKNGKPERVRTYGLASLEFQVPVTEQTVFEIGSVSKQITAGAIMLLVQDGKIQLDARISQYLPNTPPAWENVTVRHLLTHSSGIRNYTGLTGFELSKRLTAEQFIKQLSEYPLEFIPGEKSSYSNSGFNLLAYIIEARSDKRYMDFLNERIFRPLGMERTGDRDPRHIIRGRATGYEWVNDGYIGRDGNLTDLIGAGSIVSTIRDLAKWEAALHNDQIFNEQSKATMWTPFTFNDGSRSLYGFGWRISELRGNKIIGHTGQTAGFGAALFRYPEKGVTVIALTNLGELGMGSLIASSVAKLEISSLSLKNIFAADGAEPEQISRVKQILENYLKDGHPGDTATPELVRTVMSERSKRLRSRLVSYGDIVYVRFAGRESVENREVFRFLTATHTHLVLWRITFDSNGKIGEMTPEEEEIR
ncbi:serine hydrolase domain-containing protein [Leptolyngbya sp. 7M]|uniref:serine hydrolase domain-containing protein n=1 Tax=Leptolyngbya sp. 7M TaxID=2812896 RepID=UPI001B8A98DD|nr:serine hydrolase domain-containing protein [Leptolyngbya sp. 7M]QYO67625.1 beta-lactamase family protein [Leptolyngbya sp. 7M]